MRMKNIAKYEYNMIAQSTNNNNVQKNKKIQTLYEPNLPTPSPLKIWIAGNAAFQIPYMGYWPISTLVITNQ